MSEQEATIAVFRKWNNSNGGGIIALFPGTEWNNRGLVSSYEHDGQHGGADYDGVLSLSVPATPAEYANLKRELESYPFHYNLKIRERRPH